MKIADKKYPTQTHNHDCHQERPSTIIDEEIIQVFCNHRDLLVIPGAGTGAGAGEQNGNLQYSMNPQSRMR
jgi:hypothetical protein